jgi:hypothetical protein
VLLRRNTVLTGSERAGIGRRFHGTLDVPSSYLAKEFPHVVSRLGYDMKYKGEGRYR